MPLCTLCNSITLSARQYKHQPSFAELSKSAAQCDLCKLMKDVLEASGCHKAAEEYRDHRDGKWELVNDTKITTSVNTHDNEADEASLPPYQLFVTCGPLTRGNRFNKDAYSGALGYRLKVYVEQGSAAAEHIPTRPLAACVNSESTYRMIREWILACVSTHDVCQRALRHGSPPTKPPEAAMVTSETQAPLPSRLIEVLKESEDGILQLRLRDTRGLTGCYAALSHCWGSTHHLSTSISSLKERLTNIDFTKLPKTFQDAVTVTSRVGMKYLWIDSLCIIQDSKEDWEGESALMGQVYHNAYLTIAAAASPNGDGGCFHSRDLRDSHAVTLPFNNEDGSPAGCCSELERYRRDTCRVGSFISPRINFILSANILLKFENGRAEKVHYNSVTFENQELLPLYRNPHLAQIPGTREFIVTRLWMMLVANYTSRKLTFGNDKLPAISGLASHMAQLIPDKYFAGIWQGTLFQHWQLLWRVPPYRDSRVGGRTAACAGRAPSWSWASVDGPVLFAHAWTSELEPGHGSGATDDMEMKVELVGSDSYGRMARWACRKCHYKKPYRALEGYDIVQAQELDVFGAAAFDEVLESNDGLQALLFLQQTGVEEMKKEGHVNSFFVLFLLPTGTNNNDGSHGTYRRIGMGHLVMSRLLGWSRDDKRRITIV
ncbi:hypothetical protein EPUS_04887 [Endocarpon pusillum Z07020]|uniref:Heterokaryon incompatibility domain-containing protein n=1 Tax=Endocarpon pusillum (strain Z07020 / HMAS-L-300199) TaxID=1263415 RepID=U1GQV7_ENDPU|nr:uncharacterized protein EPUS_04887 [Endocarpon pusillum Z07020]ERF74718.1 hypothetical protein EPUS_04887 [Endocarpon pusillum Z07020]